MAADAERKYEEVARKLNMMENDLDKALLKADGSENKIIDLEMELKVVGDNMKCMEVGGYYILLLYILINPSKGERREGTPERGHT